MFGIGDNVTGKPAQLVSQLARAALDSLGGLQIGIIGNRGGGHDACLGTNWELRKRVRVNRRQVKQLR